VGVSFEEICQIGHWTSDFYQLYIHEYSKKEVDDSTKLLAQLNRCWAEDCNSTVGKKREGKGKKRMEQFSGGTLL
jgi:hypothetical protein